MKTHELIGEVAEVSGPETKSKKNGGGEYKIATLTIRQVDKDRSFLHMSGLGDIADRIGTFSKGEFVIVQVDISSRRPDIYWNTYVKVTSITKLPSPQTVLQPVTQPDNDSGIPDEDAVSGKPEVDVAESPVLQPVTTADNDSDIKIEYLESGEPEVDVAEPKVIRAPIAELDDFDKKFMEDIYDSKDVPETEPEKPKVVFPPVIPQKTGSDSPNEQLIDLIQKVGTEKLAELLRKASEQ